MKKLLFLLLVFLITAFLYTSKISAQSGCCSWHGGVCGCSGGSKVCCDGSFSPTCTCYSAPVVTLPQPTLPPSWCPTKMFYTRDEAVNEYAKICKSCCPICPSQKSISDYSKTELLKALFSF